MCMTKQERRRWGDMPMSFEVTKDQIAERKKFRRNGNREVHMCAWCGSAAILSNTALSRVTKNDGRHYCDLECATDHKRHLYRGDAYKDLRYGDSRKYPHCKVTWRKCIDCGSGVPSRNGNTQCRKPGCINARRAREKARQRKYEWGRRWTNHHKGTWQTFAKEMKCKECGTCYTRVRWLNSFYCGAACERKARKAHRRHLKRQAIQCVKDWINRRELFEQSKWRCKGCRRKTHWPTGDNSDREATVDHILPLSKGGLHTPENVQLLCRRCNTEKNNTIAKPMQMQLAI